MLYEALGGDYKRFALPSTHNYLFGVLQVLKREDHGLFVDQRRAAYRGMKMHPLTHDDKLFYFEQLFFTYKLMNNLKTINAVEDRERIELLQLAVMSFYYAAYSLGNCFVYAFGRNVPRTHSKTCKSFGVHCSVLAFPFNAAGHRSPTVTDDFQLTFGGSGFAKMKYDPQVLRRVELKNIDPLSAVYSYLKGTDDWYWKNSDQYIRAEKEVRSTLGKSDFKTKAAKAIRDKYYSRMSETNVLHCLYRLRGKANYRDSLFTLYGLHPATEYQAFEKAQRLVGYMIEILEYLSLDIENYLMFHFSGMQKFHQDMIADMESQTSSFSLAYPVFQKDRLHGP